MDDDVVKINIGKINCTIFRDFMFKYMAKDFFINVSDEELNQSLNKYHIIAGNIPSPFIALLLQHDNKKILIDTGVGFLEKPLIFRGNSRYWNIHQGNFLSGSSLHPNTRFPVQMIHPHRSSQRRLPTGHWQNV